MKSAKRRPYSPKMLPSAVAGSITPGRLGRCIAMSFVMFHLVVITLFAVPADMFPLQVLRDFVGPYPRCLGLNQTWDMFAPRPKSSEQFLKAIVLTANGDAQVYSFPRMEEESLFERYRDERYRKFAESSVCRDCSGLWPDIERTIARRLASAADPPTKVILLDFESPLDPQSGAIGSDAQAKPTVLSEIAIDREDLR